jgi:hypothetical protein
LTFSSAGLCFSRSEFILGEGGASSAASWLGFALNAKRISRVESAFLGLIDVEGEELNEEGSLAFGIVIVTIGAGGADFGRATGDSFEEPTRLTQRIY